MTRETIRDHIPWDEVEETRDTVKKQKFTELNKVTIHHTKIDSTGIYDLVDKLQDEVTKLDFKLHGIRDEIDELEAREIQNVLTKQKQR
jgi:hypothetical protein